MQNRPYTLPPELQAHLAPQMQPARPAPPAEPTVEQLTARMLANPANRRAPREPSMLEKAQALWQALMGGNEAPLPTMFDPKNINRAPDTPATVRGAPSRTDRHHDAAKPLPLENELARRILLRRLLEGPPGPPT